jgi:hypothetical protein
VDSGVVARPALDRLFAGVALEDHWLIEEELAALGVIPPDAFALREGGGPAEQRAECLQCLLDPIALIDGLIGAVWACRSKNQRSGQPVPEPNGRTEARDCDFGTGRRTAFRTFGGCSGYS